MDIRTGNTVFQNIFSVDGDGNPLSAATFTYEFFINGVSTTAITLSTTLISPVDAVFNVSFSSSTFGYHQYKLKNDVSNVLYMSEVYVVKPDNELPGSATLYVGL